MWMRPSPLSYARSGSSTGYVDSYVNCTDPTLRRISGARSQSCCTGTSRQCQCLEQWGHTHFFRRLLFQVHRRLKFALRHSFVRSPVCQL
jgi:hypothetical protein